MHKCLLSIALGFSAIILFWHQTANILSFFEGVTTRLPTHEKSKRYVSFVGNLVDRKSSRCLDSQDEITAGVEKLSLPPCVRQIK